MIKATVKLNFNPNFKADVMELLLTKPEVLQGLINSADVGIAKAQQPTETIEEGEKNLADVQKLTAIKSELLERMTRLKS